MQNDLSTGTSPEDRRLYQVLLMTARAVQVEGRNIWVHASHCRKVPASGRRSCQWRPCQGHQLDTPSDVDFWTCVLCFPQFWDYNIFSSGILMIMAVILLSLLPYGCCIHSCIKSAREDSDLKMVVLPTTNVIPSPLCLSWNSPVQQLRRLNCDELS